MSLGSNIRKYRRELGITQEELAGILCVSAQAVSKWESEAGLPDVSQIVPLAQTLNISTDILFGFNSPTYDRKYADEVGFEANRLRDSGEPSQGALAAARFLDKKCEENIFNYRIMMRYVQSIAHMSRFVNSDSGSYTGLLADDQNEWKRMVRLAENRAMQVIRYSEEKELADYCNYALAWVYWHTKEYEKGRKHIAALPSISSNMFQETLIPYYISATSENGAEEWLTQVRDNYQNFIRAFNKQIVYAAEGMMWAYSPEQVEENCRWGLAIMDKFMENRKMRAHCQGFYRDTYKYLIAAYLRDNQPEKAAAEWKKLISKINEYSEFCREETSAENHNLSAIYGKKAAYNIEHYNTVVEEKIQFMLGQLKSWSDEKVYEEFEKLI